MLRAWYTFLLVVAAGAWSLTSLTAGGENVAAADRPSIEVREGAHDQAMQAAALPMPEGDGLSLQRQPDGHFYADVQINGVTVTMLVDTGASGLALTRDDARKAGLGLSIGMPNVIGQGASGAVKGEFVTLDRVMLAGTTVEGMPAVVLDGGGQSLLGQNFLRRFASVEIKGDRMVLR